MESPETLLMDYIAEVKKNKLFADVGIETTNDRLLRAHKVILAASSPVLKDIFLSQRAKTVVLSDNSEVTKNLLRFMYTGSVTVSKVCDNNSLHCCHINVSYAGRGKEAEGRGHVLRHSAIGDRLRGSTRS